MSVSTKVTLPYHTRNQHILHVIAKIIGAPFEKDTYEDFAAGPNHGKKTKFNPNLEANESNDWHIDFHKDNVTLNANSDATIIDLIVKDLNNTRHSFFFMPEDPQYEQGKLLNIDSSILNVVIAKRLVDFFGGHAIFNENREEDYPKYVAGKNGNKIKFSKIKQNQSSNDRFFQFVNLLDKEPVITIAEMDWAEKIASYNTEKDKAFYKRLHEIEVENFYDKLNDLTTVKCENKTKKKI